MSASGGYNADIYVTTTDTNPSASDACAVAKATGVNRTKAELDTTHLGDANTSFILGRASAEVPLSGDYDSSDTGLSRIETAFGSGATIYIHIAFTGTSACTKVPVKVSGFDITPESDGTVTFSATLKSVGAVSTSTVS